MTVNRNRLMAWREVEAVYWDHVSLEYVAKIVANLIGKYGPEAQLVHTHERYDEGYYLAVKTKQLETVEEMQDRIRDEEIQEATERQMYERLKTKFEGEGK